MKIAYIAHPISGDVSGNIDRLKQICREINLQEPDTVPFVPYLMDLYCLDDSMPEERNRGIKNGIRILESGLVDEIRLYGNTISPGMLKEIAIAREEGIDIKPMTWDTREEFNALKYKDNWKK